MFNRIERGATVQAQDGELGAVYQVVVDPSSKDLTHIVVRPSGGGDDLMVPAEMIADATGTMVMLTVTRSTLDSMHDQLRYDQSGFQAVNPAEVQGAEANTATGHQTIVGADNNTVQFGEQGSSGLTNTNYRPIDAPSTSTTMTTAPASDGGLGGEPTGTVGQRKGKDLVGLPVLSFDDGVKFATVQDVLFDPEENQVVALLTDTGGWFKSAKVVPWSSIKTIGLESIIVPDRSVEIPADSDPYINRIMHADNILINTEVYTEDGRHIGKIGDMYLEDTTGEIVGYEVSGGVFNSTLKGKKFMPAPDTISIGKDVAFVPTEVGEQMDQQVGGLQGTAQGLTSTVGERLTDQQRSFVLGRTVTSAVTSDSGDVLVPAGKVIDESDVDRAESEGKLNALFTAAGGGAASGLLDTVKERVGGLTDKVGSVTSEQREQQLQSAIGKTAGRDVYADDGTAIAPQGTVIDPMTIERARAYGKENQLLAAVGAGQSQEAVTQAKDSISGAFSGIKAKIDEMSAQQREKGEERRINNALGRPVTRVILDRNDNVILETAQIVTNQAIDQAREAGMLDILLDSVYEADPELSPEALHSGVSGQAAIDSKYEEKRKPEDPIT